MASRLTPSRAASPVTTASPALISLVGRTSGWPGKKLAAPRPAAVAAKKRPQHRPNFHDYRSGATAVGCVSVVRNHPIREALARLLPAQPGTPVRTVGPSLNLTDMQEFS